MKSQYIPYIIIGIVLVGCTISLLTQPDKNSLPPDSLVTNFEECVAAGNPVMESYPRQCRSANGLLFVEIISPTEEPKAPITSGGCVVGGCSGQLCGEAEEMSGMVTTCEFRAEYACYRSARCERQVDKKCGWTQTTQLKSCLTNPPVL